MITQEIIKFLEEHLNPNSEYFYKRGSSNWSYTKWFSILHNLSLLEITNIQNRLYWYKILEKEINRIKVQNK